MSVALGNLALRFPTATENEIREALIENDDHAARAARSLSKKHAQKQMTVLHGLDDEAARQARKEREAAKIAAMLEAEAGTCPECWKPSCLGAVSGRKELCATYANMVVARMNKAGPKIWKMPTHEGELQTVQVAQRVFSVREGLLKECVVKETSHASLVRLVIPETTEFFSTRPDELLPVKGYLNRLLLGCGDVQLPPCSLLDPSAVYVWRCQLWTEGLFSLVFWAVGWLEESRRQGKDKALLLIDITDPRLRYRGLKDVPNLWTALFKQPFEIGSSPSLTPEDRTGTSLREAVEAAQEAGRLEVSVRFGDPWFDKLGAFRGSDQASGRLDQAGASEGRAAMRRWVEVQPRIQDKVNTFLHDVMAPGIKWLAAHIRRTDKLLQSPGNVHADAEICQDILTLSRDCGYDGVLICTDDLGLKTWLGDELSSKHGLEVATYASTLSSAGLPCHKDNSLDPYLTAEEVLIETLAMARGCDAIISTWSNVSTAAVFLSQSEAFDFHMFGDLRSQPACAAADAAWVTRGGANNAIANTSLKR